MPLVAPASKGLRNRYLILIVACIVFAAWFAYDGWKTYPANNDASVTRMIAMADHGWGISPGERLALDDYARAGWANATSAQKARVNDIVNKYGALPGVRWHSAFEIQFQQWTVLGLLLATAALVAWFSKVQRRRAVADDNGLSPAPGLTIPWDAITKIDNRRWRKKGIVNLEYRDPAGQIQKTKLDNFLLDNLPPLLNEVQERAKNAEFILPEGDEGNRPAETKTQ